MALTLTESPEHAPLIVRACLRSGVGMELPYGLDLAGLLATRIRVHDRAGRAARGSLLTAPLPDTTEEEPEDLTLPLARCHGGGDWHWAASCAIPLDPDPDPEPRMFYRVLDSGWMQRAAARPLPYHHPSKGPYRDVMMPAPVVQCRELEWRAVGDAQAVEQLLRPVAYIGRRRSVGEGKVLSWSVARVADVDPARWVHCGDGDTLIRPVPERCAEALSVPYDLGHYALRPPSWVPGRMQELAMTQADAEEWGEW